MSVVSAIEERLDEPTAKGLARAVARVVREGDLRAGDRLPPIREVARELVLSPTTVSSAWSLLVRAGTLRTAGRRGTVVADAAVPGDSRYRQAVESPAAFTVDLSTGVPDPALLPSLDRALGAATAALTPHSYLDDPVLPELATVLAEAWPYDAPALTVVDGAMDALDLVIRSELRLGDLVVVEHPAFPPLLDLLEFAGADVIGVPLDGDGMAPGALAAAISGRPVRAVFLQPRAHNPTGISTTPRRLAELADVLADSTAFVVEDDSTSSISVAPALSLGRRLPQRTIHVRSFSKSYGPDLRLAAMTGPAEVIGRVRHLRELGQGWSSRLLQRLLVDLLTDARTEREVADARAEYARRRAGFVRALAAEGIETPGSDGINVWVPVHDESAALMGLAALGIGVAPGAPFSVLPEPQGFVRVTAGLLSDDLEAVAARVAAAARAAPRSGRAR